MSNKKQGGKIGKSARSKRRKAYENSTVKPAMSRIRAEKSDMGRSKFNTCDCKFCVCRSFCSFAADRFRLRRIVPLRQIVLFAVDPSVSGRLSLICNALTLFCCRRTNLDR